MTEKTIPRSEIRLALPSKGRMAEEVIELLNQAGLHVYKPNPRQYRATIPSLPDLVVLFQAPGQLGIRIQRPILQGMTAPRRQSHQRTPSTALGLQPGAGSVKIRVRYDQPKRS